MPILRRFKKTVHDMIFGNKYRVLSSIFVSEEGDQLPQLKDTNIVSFCSINQRKFSLDNLYMITLADGATHEVIVSEESFYTLFYTVEEIFLDVGKEFCVALDVALGSSGCEAIVKGFYSLVKAHKKAGGQSNDVLVGRSIVDWLLPEPIACQAAV